MIIGVCVKISNTIYFNNKRDLIHEALPQLIFIVSLFGYMAFIIIYKWCVVYIIKYKIGLG